MKTVCQKIFWCTVVINVLLINLCDALLCHKCHSVAVNSRCRFGKRKYMATVKESCYGKAAQCYSYATVSEEGDPYFERGCALEDICKVGDDEASDLEFCETCTGRFCNNQFMELDEEVEDYLQEKLHYPTPTTTTPTPVTHSSNWYRNRLRGGAAVITMMSTKPTTRRSTTTTTTTTTTTEEPFDNNNVETDESTLASISYNTISDTESDLPEKTDSEYALNNEENSNIETSTPDAEDETEKAKTLE